MSDRISAGDVARFAYCPLNWKLSLAGERGRGGKAGMARQREVAERVDALELYQTRAKVSQDSALLLALFAVSGAALGVELFVLERASATWWLFVFLSVLWMATSLYLVVFNLYYKGRAQRLVRDAQLPEGDVVFSGSSRHSHVIESKVLPLRGRPDAIFERDDQPIPVASKAGRAPRSPYDSHVLQLAAYCYLVQEKHGKRPPSGILAYPDRRFEVAYTQELEDRLLRTLLRIQLAQRTGDVHRDHENPRRCQGCSRREACAERLA